MNFISIHNNFINTTSACPSITMYDELKRVVSLTMLTDRSERQ